MSAALLLLGWVVVASFVLPPLLRRRTFRSSPAAGVAAWQALSGSVLFGMLLAGAALTTASESVRHWFAAVLAICELLLGGQYDGPFGVVGSVLGPVLGSVLGPVLGAALTGVVLFLLARSAWTEVRAARRNRNGWATGLAVVARPDASTGALVLPHPVPAAYCIPGRHRRQVVVTTAAMELLGPAELGAVVAHERSHLRWRHHVVVATAAVLAAALPWLPVFRHALREVRRLVELMADDAAAAAHSRATLARALITITPGATDLVTPELVGRSTLTAARIARLAPGAPASRSSASGGLLALSVLSVAAPAVLFALPLATAWWSTHCTVGRSCG